MAAATKNQPSDEEELRAMVQESLEDPAPSVLASDVYAEIEAEHQRRFGMSTDQTIAVAGE